MTEREWKLRRRIDTLTDERDLAVARAGAKQRYGGLKMARCVYCGARTRSASTPPACVCHRDLLGIDPLYCEDAA